MITFSICFVLLVISYFVYGSFIEKQLFKGVKSEDNVISKTMYDGVDYMPLPLWKSFAIQLLNIAGLGPIFGAILGAAYGPVAFIWITLGGIFMGAVQDFGIGMISYYNEGKSLPEISSKYLGRYSKFTLRFLSIFFMIIVGSVFTTGPASILTQSTSLSHTFWIVIIIAYYILATLLPIDKIIGRLYPLFGATFIIMALAILYVLIFDVYTIPNLTLDSLRNMHSNSENLPIFPTLFITIACGAISGFHATQSPMMARCINSKNEAKPVFFGAMICESLIALIWASIGMAFYGGVEGLNIAITESNGNAAVIVKDIAQTTLGQFGIVAVILGVVIAPITSGDTAFRTARLIAADFTNLPQKSIYKRLILCVPIFVLSFIITKLDFDVIWRYFSWGNQIFAAFSLWTIDFYFAKTDKRKWYITIPAIFITFIVIYYLILQFM